MKRLATILAGAALALGLPAAAAANPVEKGEARLAKMLEGRVAGEPVRCITTFRSDSPQVIPSVALVHKKGDTIYVARPVHPRSLGWDDVLVVNRFSPSRWCVDDQMRTVDRTSGMLSGIVFLEEFVPYTKAG